MKGVQNPAPELDNVKVRVNLIHCQFKSLLDFLEMKIAD